MAKKNPYVHSNFERKEDDNYQTVDKRCTYGFLEHVKPHSVIDVCSPDGSGIVDTLNECGVNASGVGDAFIYDVRTDWIVSNPPYERPLVDQIINYQIERLSRNEIQGVAMLLRNNFAYAKSRQLMFRKNKYYYGEIKLLFRPKWSTPEEDAERIAAGEKVHGGVHNFVWHIWLRNAGSLPVILYSEGKKIDKIS